MDKRIILIAAFLLTGCEDGVTSNTQAQSDKARAAAEAVSFTENAEIENITARLNLTSDPGLTGFVLLLNEMGQPIMYTGIKGKITSGGKRLTQPWKRMYEGRIAPTPSDEGTWGVSDPYVYFWTTNGQYIQWNGKYLYSDKPFRLAIDPIVVAIIE